MADAPYNKVFQDQDGLFFHAEIPALAHIGLRFEELVDASLSELIPSDDPPTTVMLRDLSAKLSQSPQVQKIADNLETIKQQASETLQQLIKSKQSGDDELSEVGLDTLNSMLEHLNGFSGFAPRPENAPENDPEELASVAEESKLPAGLVKFNCGMRKKVSQAQIDLFHQFVDSQENLRLEIEAALRDMHDRMRDPQAGTGNRARFPDDPNDTDTPLQCFQIVSIDIDASSKRIVINLDTLFAHYEEHGCSILIQDGRVIRYGEWEEVFGEEDFDTDDA